MAVLRYPADFKANSPNTDYISFKLKRRNYNANPGQADRYYDDESGPGGSKQVILYMPQKISEANSQNYSHSSLGPEASSALTGSNVRSGGITNSPLNVGDLFRRLIENKLMDDVISGLRTLGASLNDANSVLSATSGVIYNPMMEVLYSGPNFRKFSYQFMLFAKSGSDAQQIYDIVRFFQYASVPSLNGSLNTGRIAGAIGWAGAATATQQLAAGTASTLSSSLSALAGGKGKAGAVAELAKGSISTAAAALGTGLVAGGGAAITNAGLIFDDVTGNSRFIKQPPQVEIRYMRGANDHPYILSPSICALESINIDYTPSGNYTVMSDFSDGRATTVATLVSLTFVEMKIKYAEDYGVTTSTTPRTAVPNYPTKVDPAFPNTSGQDPTGSGQQPPLSGVPGFRGV